MTRRRPAGLATLVLLITMCLGWARVVPAASRDVHRAPSQRRLALVIGNSRYVPPLENPGRDARAMAVTLRGLRFKVTLGLDLDQGALKRAVRDFGARLAAPGSIGLFYFSGHGVQVAGQNYLVPVATFIDSEGEVKTRTLPLNQVFEKMNPAGRGTAIVILDACRNNPFQRLRSSPPGLAFMEAPAGSFIAYSTGPGAVASDGLPGQHGVFTGHLLEVLRTPGLPIEAVFKQVRQRVGSSTQGRQVPRESTSLTTDFFFHLARENAPPLTPAASDAAIAAAPPARDEATDAAPRLAVRVVPPEGNQLLRQRAASCLAQAGWIQDEHADSELTLELTLDPELLAGPGLYLVRGHLLATLKRADRDTPALGEARVKGAGPTPQAAARDTVRRFAMEELGQLLPRLLHREGTPLPVCAPPP